MIQNKDYWTENYHKGFNRPPNDYYHPSMPATKLCHAFGTFWYKILEDCAIMWKHSRYHYPKGWIVYEKRTKPVPKLVNYKWLMNQPGYSDDSPRGWQYET